MQPLRVLMAAMAALICGLGIVAEDLVASYQKSTEGHEVVKPKKYSKDKKLELSVPNLGMVLNESYVKTYLIGGGGSYYLTEEWGLGVDITVGMNQDKEERTCVESFYNDPLNNMRDVCNPDPASVPTDPAKKVSYGPAYVPIRELKTIATANAIWTPVYGKALIFMNAIIYFDLYFEGGLGIAMSNFYPKKSILNNGNPSRGTFQRNGDPNPEFGSRIGATPAETNSYGEAGRPQVTSQSNILFDATIGQKFHFAKNFHLKIFLRDLVLIGTPQGFENYLTFFGGVGMRF